MCFSLFIFFVVFFCLFKVMERAVKDYCDKPDRLELHNPSAWFTHHAHELCFRSDPEDLEAGARDWLNDEKIKAGGRSRDKERAAKKARGERVDGPARGMGRGGSGSGRGSSSGWVSRGGGSRIMGQGRGGVGRGNGGRGGRGDGGDAGGSGGGEGGGRGGVGVGAAKTEVAARIRPPGDPAAGGGRGGGGGVQGAESERYSQRDTSDLMSIFPSLRGRGGGRAGGVGGRGGGGRGFRQGGIRA